MIFSPLNAILFFSKEAQLALKAGGQKTLSIQRLWEIARTCAKQRRYEAMEAFQRRISEASEKRKGSVRFDELTLPEQETVEWVESLGNRQT